MLKLRRMQNIQLLLQVVIEDKTPILFEIFSMKKGLITTIIHVNI